ncbi:Thioredoxin, putative [Angomonas deanei]|uniref:Thioredoxin, putative n=1 Tax=Angomonas deanei TaxID=59799 RepID=A0A7G2C470_9TRYP|nr:Thioredoxin, putative [Angomonas deanei]
MARLLPWVTIFLVLGLLSVQSSFKEDVILGDPEAPETDQTHFKLPPAMAVLSTNNFDEEVFSGTDSWIIFFYAPWCNHCRNMMPQFINASITLEAENSVHSRFAVANGQGNSKLIDRFKVDAFPTILYTTGKDRKCHHYRGGHNYDSFLRFARYLERSARAGTFVEDVTEVESFQKMEKDNRANRVPFYIYVPASSPVTAETVRDATWNPAIDGAATLGNSRYAALFEKRLPGDWRSSAPASYKKVVEGALECAKKGYTSGPNGEVFFTVSDRFSSAECYRGPWVEPNPKAINAIHPWMELFIASNGFRAVEELNSGLFSIVTQLNKTYLGLIVTKGSTITPDDQNYIPVLRAITQSQNEKLHQKSLSVLEELESGRVQWSYVDSEAYPVWQTRYAIADKHLPAFLIIDTKRDRMFRLRTRVPEFEKIKNDIPWQLNGPQHELIENFVEEVLADRYWGEKTVIVGTLTEYLSYLPGLRTMYKWVGYDDFTFIIAAFALGFFVFLMFIGLVAEPLMERYDEKQKALQKKKND